VDQNTIYDMLVKKQSLRKCIGLPLKLLN